MLITTLLNKIEKFKSFVYEKAHLEQINGEEAIVVALWILNHFESHSERTAEARRRRGIAKDVTVFAFASLRVSAPRRFVPSGATWSLFSFR